MQKTALISVSNKENIEIIAKELEDLGFLIISSSGTYKYLSEKGIAVTKVSDYTKFPEILGGRVKTLHPKIHAGLLAKTDDKDHIKDLEENEINPISVCIVNLYPFSQNLNSDTAKDKFKMTELIDIGGPAMIRAAAKNYKYVLSLIDPADYPFAIKSLKGELSSQEDTRFREGISSKVFSKLSDYNYDIGNYYSDNESINLKFSNNNTLRYGENPHQKASFYFSDKLNWKQISGKELSYNNILDFDSTLKMLSTIKSELHFSVIVKHLNPCGGSIDPKQLSAYKKAKLGDTRSHFGGIIGFNKEVDQETASEVIADFKEIIIAPSFSASALEILKTKKNLRIIKVDLSKENNLIEYRSAVSGLLSQEKDVTNSKITEWELVAGPEVSEELKSDLELSWNFVSHIKSNAICLVKDSILIGSGSGQMSRIDSTELAISKAKFHNHDLNNSVAASDAFFPFEDSIEVLRQSGVVAVVTVGGSMGDSKVIEKANELGMSLYFTKDRHFRH